MKEHKDLLALYQKIGDVAGQIKYAQKLKKSVPVIGSNRSWTPSELIKLQWKRLNVLTKAIDMHTYEIMDRLNELKNQLCSDCKLAVSNGTSPCNKDNDLFNEYVLLKVAIDDSG